MMNLDRSHPFTQYFVAGVSLGLLTLFFYVLVFGDGQTDDYRPSTDIRYDRIDVCPSMVDQLATYKADGAELRLNGAELPPISAGPCTGNPEPGTVQLRAHNDLLGDYPPNFAANSIDRIAHMDGNRTAVAYAIETTNTRKCTPKHILGHLAGYREHDKRATSVMADPCGSRVDVFQRTP